MKSSYLILSALFLLIAPNSFGSTLIRCEVTAKISSNSGILQPGSDFLEIRVPIGIDIISVETLPGSHRECNGTLADSNSFQLTVPLQLIQESQVGLKVGNEVVIRYLYAHPRGGNPSTSWTLLSAPIQ